MTKTLATVFALAVASMATIAQAQQVKGDAKAGEGKIAMCIGCHGIERYQASFPEVYKVPMIGGQSAPYIVSALEAYKKGDRRHPTMRAIADTLTEQDIADVAAYYAEHGKPAPTSKPKEPSKDVSALLQKGACFSCHGDGFAKPIDASYPKVAGQYADYIYVSLKAYKTEKNPMVGRNNAIMGGMVKQFSDSELKQISKYIGSLDTEMSTVREPEFRTTKK